MVTRRRQSWSTWPARGIVASTTPYRTAYARVAPSLINNEEEVVRTVVAIAEPG